MQVLKTKCDTGSWVEARLCLGAFLCVRWDNLRAGAHRGNWGGAGVLQSQAKLWVGPTARGHIVGQLSPKPGVLSSMQREQFCDLGRNISIWAPAVMMLIALSYA